jgi:hypothetical protein
MDQACLVFPKTFFVFEGTALKRAFASSPGSPPVAYLALLLAYLLASFPSPLSKNHQNRLKSAFTALEL